MRWPNAGCGRREVARPCGIGALTCQSRHDVDQLVRVSIRTSNAQRGRGEPRKHADQFSLSSRAGFLENRLQLAAHGVNRNRMLDCDVLRTRTACRGDRDSCLCRRQIERSRDDEWVELEVSSWIVEKQHHERLFPEHVQSGLWEHRMHVKAQGSIFRRRTGPQEEPIHSRRLRPRAFVLEQMTQRNEKLAIVLYSSAEQSTTVISDYRTRG